MTPIRYASYLDVPNRIANNSQVIKLHPSSYRGYEMRHAALHGASRFAEAVEAFDTMLSKLEGSPDIGICHTLIPRYHSDSDYVLARADFQCCCKEMSKMLDDAERDCKSYNEAAKDSLTRTSLESLGTVLRAHELRHHCEILYGQDRMNDAFLSLLEIVNTANEAVRASKFIMDWGTGEFLSCALDEQKIG